jgi:D-alanine-D-alanine ligase
MRIGLTYDLRESYLAAGHTEEETAEFDRPETPAAIREALSGFGHEVVAVGSLPALVEALARGERYDLVFNIAEGLRGTARESQVPALLDAYGIPYTFSGPLTLALALHKGHAKRIVQDAGLPTSPFFVLKGQELPETVPLDYPLFVKPAAEGSGMGIDSDSRIDNRAGLEQRIRILRTRFSGPLLVERYLPGREFTVGILGTGQSARVLGILEIDAKTPEDRAAYGYLAKEEYDTRIDYRPVPSGQEPAVAALALAVHRLLECDDASRVDIRLDGEDRPLFLEINPLAGIHPLRSDLVILARAQGWSYSMLIGAILESALSRSAADASGRT